MRTISPKISYDERRFATYVSPLVRATLEEICLAAGLEEIWVTSAYRDAVGQARAMYDNLKAGHPAQGSAAQRNVNAVYTQMVKTGETDQAKILSAMADKINQIGPAKVSHHSRDPRWICVLDISVKRMPESKRNAFVAAVRARMGLWIMAFGHPPEFGFKGGEFYDPVFHLELLNERSQQDMLERLDTA